MSKEERIEYLEEERKKIWERLTYIEDLVSKKTSDYEADAKNSSEQAAVFKSESEESKNIIVDNLAFTNKKLEELKTSYAEFDQLFETIRTKSVLIEEKSNSVISLYEKTDSQSKTVEKQILEIEKIFESKPLLDEKLLRLNEVFNRGDDYDSKLGTLHKAITDRKKEIDELYYEIIGYTEQNGSGEEIIVKGLKNQLEESYILLTQKIVSAEKDLSTLKDTTISNYETFSANRETQFNTVMKKWEEEYSNVLKQIENLLPNALTTGLSYAYSEKKEAEERENINHSATFKYAIYGLVFVSLIPFIVAIVSIVQKDTLQTVIYRIPRLVLAILPLYLPVLWLAYSSNRKMNLAKRLIEEYSHKEVLSKTFEGLSKQINNIDDKDVSSDLRIKLLHNILEVNSENPGKLISDYNKTDHPLMDALDKSIKLTNAVTRLSKIPGFAKLASTLEKKSQAILQNQEKMANAGLESLVDDHKTE
ncbi:MAG: hypothetical protein HY252_02150 [Sphingobacteriales bacterium]|nr:hypothetical protein [Sphingobacteriales bacterium]